MEAEPGKRRFRRSQFAVVLVLSPLNNTFERKCLVIPFAPEVLKLGRQTTARSAAGPDNGFFDSRVLSRQHAEVWADRETGKVWLRDCKSSNGTYINRQRLSNENTESEPFELKRNDQLDLGIDIMCNDDTKQVYKKISAKVEKVSMLPLNVSVQQRQPASQTPPPIHRSPSLETLRAVDTSSGGSVKSHAAEAIFGGSLEAIALNHANTTAGGLMIKDSVKTHINFELAAKRLVAQTRAVMADTAKMESVASLLAEIKQEAQSADAREQAERAKREADNHEAEVHLQSSSLAALKVENARLRAELANIRGQPSRGQRGRGVSVSVQAPQPPLQLDSPPAPSVNAALASARPPKREEVPTRTATRQMFADSRSKVHNLVVLVGTTGIMTFAGVCIMFFFNPPMADHSKTPLFFSKFVSP